MGKPSRDTFNSHLAITVPSLRQSLAHLSPGASPTPPIHPSRHPRILAPQPQRSSPPHLHHIRLDTHTSIPLNQPCSHISVALKSSSPLHYPHHPHAASPRIPNRYHFLSAFSVASAPGQAALMEHDCPLPPPQPP